MYTGDNPKKEIVVRWTVTGKDKYGDSISLAPVFDFDSEDGCGVGNSKSMLCLSHFTGTVDTHGEYSEVSITNKDGGTGFRGKISSSSARSDIENTVQDLNEAGDVTLNEFLSNPDLGVTFPEFHVIYEHGLYKLHESGSGKGDPIPLSYQFVLDGVENSDASLSDNRFKVTASGSYNGSKQEIETTVEKGSLLPVFNYVIFGE